MQKVFAMNDCDWYAAQTAEEAASCMAETMGYKSADELRADGIIEAGHPRELSGEQLDKLKFFDEDADITRTFREHLDLLIIRGASLPCFFASTEF